MKNITLKQVFVSSIVVTIIGFVLALTIDATRAWAGYIASTQPVQAERFVRYDFFASSTPNQGAPTTFATTTSATSTEIVAWTDENGRIDNGYAVVAGADKVTFYFSRGGATSPNTGSSTFNVEVSEDGSTWTRYNKLISNVTNSNSQTLTRAEQYVITAATSTVIASLSPEDSVYAVRCIVREVTDGEHRCKAVATWK